MYKHMFLLRASHDIPPRLVIDSFVSEDWDIVLANYVTSKLREEIMTPSILGAAKFGMIMRARHNCDMHGPLLVNDDEKISREFMQSIIDGMTPERLKEFIKEAKC